MDEQASETAQSDAEPDGPDPKAWASRIAIEFAAARKEIEQWHKDGDLILKRFRDERPASEEGMSRWNAYPMNIQTQRAMVYGKTPSVNVERRNADPDDEVGRVASGILERMLNLDLHRSGDGYVDGLAYALDDRMQVGLGQCRARYAPTFETVDEQPAMTVPGPDGQPMEMAEAIPEHDEKTDEDVFIDYLHWKDQLYSAGARVWHEVRLIAFKEPLTRKQLIERFAEPMARLLDPDAEDAGAAGESLARSIPLNHKRDKGKDSQRGQDPWPKADVWEVWSKEHGCVVWYVEGFPTILDHQEDPLELEGFWPCPRPMEANLTTSTRVPRPDFMLAKDQYNELDRVTARISLLVEALRVAGAYDKTNPDLQRLVKETSQNELIPVDNWAMFAEKGGIKGAIDLFPIDIVASVLQAVRDYRQEVLASLYQITGFSDIMRGESIQSNVSATEQRAKTNFASVRMRALQDEFARFASDLQKIKAEIICKHFDAETIKRRSNIMMTADAPLADLAIELLKSDHSQWRIEVKPEAVNLTDFAALKQEKTEFLTALTGFVQGMMPVVQMMPGATPYMLEMLKWYMAGQRDSSGVQSILDKAIAAAEQMAMQPHPQQQQGPSPEQIKMQTVQMKGQQDLLKVQADLKAKLIEKQADVQAEDAKEQAQAHWNIVEARGKRSGMEVAPMGAPGILGGGLT